MPRKDSCDSAALYIQALDQGCTYLGTLPTVEVELGLSYPPRSYLPAHQSSYGRRDNPTITAYSTLAA